MQRLPTSAFSSLLSSSLFSFSCVLWFLVHTPLVLSFGSSQDPKKRPTFEEVLAGLQEIYSSYMAGLMGAPGAEAHQQQQVAAPQQQQQRQQAQAAEQQEQHQQ